MDHFWLQTSSTALSSPLYTICARWILVSTTYSACKTLTHIELVPAPVLPLHLAYVMCISHQVPVTSTVLSILHASQLCCCSLQHQFCASRVSSLKTQPQYFQRSDWVSAPSAALRTESETPGFWLTLKLWRTTTFSSTSINTSSTSSTPGLRPALVVVGVSESQTPPAVGGGERPAHWGVGVKTTFTYTC